MNRVLLINEESETINLLIKYLKAAGFEVIAIENDLISVQLLHGTNSITGESQQSNTPPSIFPPIPRLRQVFEFIELNYHQPIRLKEVAQAVGYSAAYLTDLVKRATGKTVNDWIIERRLVEASRLLLETKDSIEQIAFKVGYKNINHFYCQFRDHHKKTPHSWRESKRRHIRRQQ